MNHLFLRHPLHNSNRPTTSIRQKNDTFLSSKLVSGSTCGDKDHLQSLPVIDMWDRTHTLVTITQVQSTIKDPHPTCGNMNGR